MAGGVRGTRYASTTFLFLLFSNSPFFTQMELEKVLGWAGLMSFGVESGGALSLEWIRLRWHGFSGLGFVNGWD